DDVTLLEFGLNDRGEGLVAIGATQHGGEIPCRSSWLDPREFVSNNGDVAGQEAEAAYVDVDLATFCLATARIPDGTVNGTAGDRVPALVTDAQRKALVGFRGLNRQH